MENIPWKESALRKGIPNWRYEGWIEKEREEE